jgi:UDP-GlcNAc:undecaprenyl-phosphate GlcNAc-1-phosphate transferase
VEMRIISSLLLAFGVVFLGTPLVKKLAYKIKALDQPAERKVHNKPMPRLGGLAICLGFWLTVLLTTEMTSGLYGLLVGGLLITLVGIIDDIKGVTARQKLVVQIVAASIVIYAGVRVDFITHPVKGVISLGYWSYPLTLLWIIGITNAVNLIDGLDGLAAGVSAIAAVTLGVIAYLETSQQAAMLALILAASIFGFLKYNFHPAQIFMGDTGSLFLGFNLSVLAIIGLTKSATIISLFLPVVILGIPIIDTLFAIMRRYFGGRPIFSADKEHLHHRLLRLGLSHEHTVLAMYGVSVVLSFSAIIMALVTTAQGMLIMVALILGLCIGAEKLGILHGRERQECDKQSQVKDEKVYHHLTK